MILDTNALSAWAENDSTLLATLPPAHTIILPAVAIGEYLYGVWRSTHRDRLESWLNRAIKSVRVGNITLDTAESYAAVRLTLRRKGRPIPTNDAWIAALALQHGLPVLSRDAHFDVVDGLTRVAW